MNIQLLNSTYKGKNIIFASGGLMMTTQSSENEPNDKLIPIDEILVITTESEKYSSQVVSRMKKPMFNHIFKHYKENLLI